jgi:hypothetical protein
MAMASDNVVKTDHRELTEAEREEFILDNSNGFLGFGGDKPYVIPVAYFYRQGTFIIGLAIPGRKVDYIERSLNVCFTISKSTVEYGFKKPCTGVMVEGELEEVTDRAYYGFPLRPDGNSSGILFRIKADNIGSRKCTNKPCQVYTPEIRKNWVSAEESSRQLHEGKRGPK